jgi:hypothetical protein
MMHESNSAFELLPPNKPAAASGKRWAIGLWTAQVLSIVVAMVAASIEFRSIVVTGPILCVIGLALATATRPLRSWMAQLFALSGPLISAFCALLIAVFHLGPGDARRPILTIFATYILFAIPVALVSLRQIAGWPAGLALRGRYLLRFSLKSLLILMTAACVLLLPLQVVVSKLPFIDFSTGFGLFAAVTAALACVVLWRFNSGRGQPGRARDENVVDAT